MARGFNFNIDRCVACHACIIACSLENGQDMPWRMVVGDNADTYPGLPVHNISMACNHCEDAPCMTGCPANAYYRDETNGTVQIMPERCIGCQYCYWNCPYDAPRYNPKKKEVEKCNLCYNRLNEGIDPACVTACPTGALSFSDIDSGRKQNLFTDSGTLPRLSVIECHTMGTGRPDIVPFDDDHHPRKAFVSHDRKVTLKSEWSLMIFTYLSSLLFATNISNWFGIVKISPLVYSLAMGITLLIPLLHLGKPLKAWRSISGIFRSPLSNEIAALLLFSLSSVPAYIFYIRELWIISFVAGFLLLVSVDSIYTSSDSRFSFKIHPGQSFLSGLLMASYFLNTPLPFIFVGIIKIVAAIYYIYKNRRQKGFVIFTIIQTLVLIYLSSSILGLVDITLVSIILLLISELAGRIFYYLHFYPVSLFKTFFDKNIDEYEKAKTN